MTPTEALKIELEERIENYQGKLLRIEQGEQVCENSWNTQDLCFDVYCTHCKKLYEEVSQETELPLEKDAVCYECQKPPEQKEAERLAKEYQQQKRELEQLAVLKAKYPDA